MKAESRSTGVTSNRFGVSFVQQRWAINSVKGCPQSNPPGHGWGSRGSTPLAERSSCVLGIVNPILSVQPILMNHNSTSLNCTVNSRAPADRYCHCAVATGDAFDHCPLPSPPLAVGSTDPAAWGRGRPKPGPPIVVVPRRRKSVGYWPLAINIPTHSGARSWAGSRLNRRDRRRVASS